MAFDRFWYNIHPESEFFLCKTTLSCSYYGCMTLHISDCIHPKDPHPLDLCVCVCVCQRVSELLSKKKKVGPINNSERESRL